MNQFHELNILTSRGDLRSAFLLIKSYSEGVARKIMKRAGYYVPDVKGSSFWMFVQETITNAARNRTSGYRKSIVNATAGRSVHQVLRCVTDNSSSYSHTEQHADMPAALHENNPQADAQSEMHSSVVNTAPPQKFGSPENRPETPKNGKAPGVISGRLSFCLKIMLFWLLAFFLVSPLSQAIALIRGYSNPFIVNLIVMLGFYSLSLLVHHVIARVNIRKEVFLRFQVKEGAAHASLPLCTYLPESRNKLITLLAKSTCDQMRCSNMPVIMRSHFLSYRRQRDVFLKELEKENICWEMTAGPERPQGWRRFVLYWITPVIIGSFQGRRPSLGSMECELKLTYCPGR